MKTKNWQDLEEKMKQTKNSLFIFIYRIVLDKHTAEDVFQETWLRVVQKIDSYNPSYSFNGWLFTIAKNLCVDHLRKEKRRNDKEHFLYTHKEGKNEDFESSVENREFILCFESLPIKFREAIHLRFFEEMEYEEIARVLMIPAGTVKSRVNRGLIKLRKIWRKNES